jgi:hypothetical protein
MRCFSRKIVFWENARPTSRFARAEHYRIDDQKHRLVVDECERRDRECDFDVPLPEDLLQRVEGKTRQLAAAGTG